MKLLTAEGRLLPLAVMFFFTLAATGMSISAAFADGSPGPVTAGAPVIELAQAKKDELLDKDDLLLDKDDKDSLLDGKDDKGAAKPEKKDKKKDVVKDAEAAHEALFAESRYPSAGTCGTCHPKHYQEWAVSQHSYAQLSPVYLSLNNKINELANGSNGDFCLRCHNQVGANLGENSFVSNLERHPTSREGITCVVCHRINKNYNKASGRLALVEGGLTAPIYGPTGNKELARVLDNTHQYRVVTDPKKAVVALKWVVGEMEDRYRKMSKMVVRNIEGYNGRVREQRWRQRRDIAVIARGIRGGVTTDLVSRSQQREANAPPGAGEQPCGD